VARVKSAQCSGRVVGRRQNKKSALGRHLRLFYDEFCVCFDVTGGYAI